MSDENKTIIDMAKEFQATKGIENDVPADAEVPVTAPKAPKATTHGLADGKVPDILKDLLGAVNEKMAWVPVDLPSRGQAYTNLEGNVNIRPFSFQEEKLLRSISKVSQGREVIGKIFEACVKGIAYDALTVPDKNYILFKLREISYGNDYPVVFNCNNCKTENRMRVEIDQIPINYVSDDYEEPFKFMLPDAQKEVMAVSPRSKDEDYMATGEVLTQNLWRFVQSVGGYKDKVIIKKFIEATTARDVATIRDSLINDDYGLDQEVTFDCIECGSPQTGSIPLNEHFFSPS
tara:strand:+ start:718 stop:1590 length:873 start_codon:yes stop_codon:yes gene_type:complete